MEITYDFDLKTDDFANNVLNNCALNCIFDENATLLAVVKYSFF